MEMLVEKGADVNAKKYSGKTSIMLACVKGHTEAVRLLIEKGADVNAKANDGSTAFTIASEKEHTDIMLILNNANTLLIEEAEAESNANTIQVAINTHLSDNAIWRVMIEREKLSNNETIEY